MTGTAKCLHPGTGDAVPEALPRGGFAWSITIGSERYTALYRSQPG